MKITAKDLCALVGGELEGDPNVEVSQPSKIEEGKPGSISFLANSKYEPHIYTTEASVVLVKRDLQLASPVATTLIRVDDPYATFVNILKQYSQALFDYKGISELAYIHPEAQVGEDVYIGPFTYIGKAAQIGDGSKIYPNTTVADFAKVGKNVLCYSGVHIYHFCQIGDGSILHSGAVIGSDGFGFAPKPDGTYDKIPQIGNVVLGKNVEVGANTVIDRATMGSTVIRDGVKLDNLVQLAHNVEVGNNTVIAAQAGVAGSTKLGANCVIGGQAGFVGHIEVADGTKVNAKSGISKSVKKEGQALSGTPAFEWREEIRAQVVYRKLPLLEKRIQELEAALNAIKEK
ncbi:MAG: UDP-3-O-(3-hydroxymyristoyl)glucosamine N-acyltransferase [Saprospiraceae bacterium]|nr:UDP-3-O-(3-hydroxymyristoyl)glucosamine N-acyltransferase [Saprospiraceae bacterium]